VMRQYQRELEADERALEENSSDDDDDQSKDHVPWDWQNYDSHSVLLKKQPPWPTAVGHMQSPWPTTVARCERIL
jgi:hypothetical protein